MFIGYSDYHKGQQEEYFSRHVYFNEKEFSYSSLFNKELKATTTNSDSILSWLPVSNITTSHHCSIPQTNSDIIQDQPNSPNEPVSPASPTTTSTDTYKPSSPSFDPIHSFSLPSSNPTPMVVNEHPMTTRAKAGIFKLRQPYGYLAQLQSNPNWSQLEPTLYRDAASSNQWRQAMDR